MLDFDQEPQVAAAKMVNNELQRIRRDMVRSVSAYVYEQRLQFAKSFVHRIVSRYWDNIQKSLSARHSLRACFETNIPTVTKFHNVTTANQVADYCVNIDKLEASYQIGLFYTMLLPETYRAQNGIYYTPPSLSNRLIELATIAGVDWNTCKVLDPACGGGAFLAPVAKRIAEQHRANSARSIIDEIGNRLRGFELDPFGAWLSQVLLDATLVKISDAAGQPTPLVVTVCDSLQLSTEVDKFDLVIGNPPYGKIKLSQDVRVRYRRSLYGHANLYGLFTDFAVEVCHDTGVIAYVTPTGFLGGEYFKNLRALLWREARPHTLDLIADRKNVFEGVLQETLLASYCRKNHRPDVRVNFLMTRVGGNLHVENAGNYELPENPTDPWLLPRSPAEKELVKALRRMDYRLRDYGYKVSTGPLVWNRHKEQLTRHWASGRFPVIWAESVLSDGIFQYRAEKKNHLPYLIVRKNDDWLVIDEPCVLVQRTTAKEQKRRLIAAELPQSFLSKYGGAAVENHLNMIRPTVTVPKISVATLTRLLNTTVVDAAFRCINGSVAVSASELENLPLPDPRTLRQIEFMVTHGFSDDAIEGIIRDMYGQAVK